MSFVTEFNQLPLAILTRRAERTLLVEELFS